MSVEPIRNLVVVLGDQLNETSSAFDEFDPTLDAVWMAEVHEESTKVWSSKVRTAFFLSAMRHFAETLRQKGFRVFYHALELKGSSNFTSVLEAHLKAAPPQKIILVEPGEYSVRKQLCATADRCNITLELHPDRHFICSPEAFAEHAAGRKQLRMEYFYRGLRKSTGLLMEDDQPAGGSWNYDVKNRGHFGKNGPDTIPPPLRFTPDPITREVLQLVNKHFPDHPGTLNDFDWPVTRKEALNALEDFIIHRLALFGQYQDAMWTAEPWLYHARISAALNVKLLDPLEVCHAVEHAWKSDPERIPLNAAEGFIRQVLGWREFVRGIYELYMPEYLERNAMGAHADLPDFYWTGDTDMQCLRQSIEQTLRYGYAHHIQRLMVTGLYALLYGVDPRQVHTWYLAVYIDAVEWVELPNTLGMSQYADGGIMASKPYTASGKYIQRMSNYCADCRFNPAKRTGDDACPFTTLYWHYLIQHRETLQKNPRMSLQLKNLDRLDPATLQEITDQAKRLRKDL
jgi:deoxyribodipyrimidine photolyase-related protein